MNMHSLSVVVPVYNVAPFIKKTIASILEQSQVTEIVIVDDGSTDESFDIVKRLCASNVMINLYQHTGGVNKGRGATRNLGILKAKGTYIAFLDADDFYLKNRFKKDFEMLTSHKVDGVYNAVGFHYYRKIFDHEMKHFKRNTINKKLAPEELFSGIVKSKYGFLHLNGITVRREVFDKIGLLNEALIVTQDTDIIFKMALKVNLYPGELEESIALRGVHKENVFVREDLYKKYTPQVYESVIKWGFKQNIGHKKIDELLDALWQFKFTQKESLFSYTMYWLRLLFRNPQMILTSLSLKYFPIVRKRKWIFSFLYS